MSKKPAKRAPAPKKGKQPLPQSIVQTVPSSQQIATLLHQMDAQVNQLSQEFRRASKTSPYAAARAFVALHRLHDRIEETTKGFNAVFNKAKVSVLPDLLDRAGVPNVTLDEGFRVQCKDNLQVAIRGGMREEAYQHLRKHGLEDLITETVSAATLSALARHLLEDENRELPEKLFSYEYVGTTSVHPTKSKSPNQET